MSAPAVSRAITPGKVAPPAARYSHAVLTEGAGRWLHTSGVVPASPGGGVPEGLHEQAALVWQIIAVLLAEAAMSVGDVVSVTTYVVAGNDLGVVMAARDEAMGGHEAASTLVLVPALARPEWRLEVAVVAAAP
ncbi:MAG: RidA family protein [Acidimicrobiia bacterium]|nr:RidA family protein [Acidimicrobiia bacterium]